MRETLASLVEDWRRCGPEIAVVVHRGNRRHRTSYGSLATLAGRFAAELKRRGIDAGDRVVLWGENSPEWMAAFFGCLLRGVLAVPLDAAGSVGFAERVIADTAPRLVVGDGLLLGQLRTDAVQMDLSRMPVELPVEPDFELSTAVEESAPFQIVFTSGTTSEPKGIVHTHRNVLASLRPIEAEIRRYGRYERWVHPLRFLHTLPFSHVFGQFMGLWIPALLRAEIHLPTQVDPGRFARLIQRERISVLVAVPRVLALLRGTLRGRFPEMEMQLAASDGIPAWKRWWRFRRVHAAFGFKFWAVICGGATLPAELESFWNGLGFALIQGYGMTETAALVTLNHPFKVGRGTLGKTLPGREVRLSPEGEILVRGDVLAAGTWRDGGFQARSEEWLATGDLGQQDAGGELRFTGRRGDVIVTAAGMNVYPRDVEAALERQVGVRACVVVGCDGGTGPEPVGVALFTGDDGALRKVLVGANAGLASYQQMRRVLRWPEPSFPYTATGKLLRRQVMAWACAEMRAPAQTGTTEVHRDALLRVVAEVARGNVTEADDGSRLTEDLQLDSLGRVQLQSALEQRFGVEVTDERMAVAQTLGDLRALVSREAASGADVPARAGTGEVGTEVSVVRRLRYLRWPWSAPVRWVRSVFLEAVAMPLVWLLAKPRIVRDAEPPEDTPMLLIANHVGLYDLPLLLSALPWRRRHRVAVAMSGEVLGDLRFGRGQGHAVLNWLARPAYWLSVALFNVFPLPRSVGFRESFAHAGEALDRGYSVLVFPEGRRGRTGELQPFRQGIGLLVQASQVAVLPVALQGAGGTARGGGGWFRPPGLAVHVGEPMQFPVAMSPEVISRQLEDALRALQPS